MNKIYIILFTILGYFIKYLEELYKNIKINYNFENNIFFIINKKGLILYRNKNFNNILLYNNKKMNINNIIINEDEKFKTIVNDNIKKNIKLKCADGTIKYYDFYIKKIFVLFKKNYYYKIIGKNENISLIQKKFNVFLDTVPIGILEYNFKDKYINFNNNLVHILNDNKDSNDFNIKKILKKFNIDDYYNILIEIYKLINKSNNTSFKYMCKYYKKNKEAWIEIIGNINIDKYNELSFIIIYFKDITNIKENEDELKRLYYYDKLTDLPNKNSFYYKLTKLIELNPDRKSALIIACINNINSIIEAYGYDLGDMVLIAVANRIKEISHYYYLCRFNFNKIAIFIANYEEEEIKNYLNLLLENISIKYKDEERLKVRLSLGISLYPKDTNNLDTLLKYADIAVNDIKEKNKYVFFEKYMDKRVKERAYLELELAKALEIKEQLKLYFQPQYNFSNGKLVGFEALSRLENKNNSFISPDTFIPIAEKTGYIIPLGLWVLQESCFMIKSIKEKGYEDIIISVNISGEQLKNNNIVENIKSIINETEIDSKYLNLEITESILMENFDDYYKKITEICNLGIMISLDDFGKGYSSLSSLKDLPISELKIDKSFIDNIENFEINRSIVNQIVMLAKLLKIKTVAEGVELKEQYDYLKKIGCDYAQGYFCGKPVPKEGVYKILKDKIKINID